MRSRTSATGFGCGRLARRAPGRARLDAALGEAHGQPGIGEARGGQLLAEEGRVAVRNVRRDVMRHLEELVKNGEVGDDEERAAETRVQKLTDEHVAKIDDLLKRKEADIMEV